MADLDHLEMPHMAPPPTFNDLESLGLPIAAKVYLDCNMGEGRVLAELVKADGDIVANEVLARAVSWPDAPSRSNAVKVHVFRLREAMSARGCPGEILTIRNTGYALSQSGEVLAFLRSAAAMR